MVLSATIHSISGIPVGQLLDHPDNPRRDLGDLTELVASIKAGGILEPPIVVPKDTGKRPTFLIVAGHRRVAAARLAGLVKVPCIIRSDLDGRGVALETMLVENLQRADLDPVAEARALGMLVNECGFTQAKVSERIGRSQAHVSKRLKLLQLPDEVLAFVGGGKCTLGDALALADVDDPVVLKASVAEAKRYAGKGEGLADVSRAIVQQQQLAEMQQRMEKVAGKLNKLGIRIVETYAKGWQSVSGGNYGDARDFAVPDPHTADCLAAASHVNGAWSFYCTKPRTHAGAKPAEPSHDSLQRQKRKLLKEAAVPRRAFVGEHIVRPTALSRATLTELLVWSTIRGGYSGEEIAAEWLGISMLNARVTLTQRALDSTPQGRERIAVAVALARVEALLIEQHHRWDHGELRYFDLLAAHGYAPTEIEAEQLDAARKRVGTEVQTTIDDAVGEPPAADSSLAGPKCAWCGCTEMEACEGGCEWAPGGLDGHDICTLCQPACAGKLHDGDLGHAWHPESCLTADEPQALPMEVPA